MTARILILGGSRFQVPLIRRAKERGLRVITCDYLPENPMRWGCRVRRSRRSSS